MFNFKDINVLKFIATFSLIVILAACDSSNDGISFDPDVAPQNVQVVSGDDNTSEVQNTISWTQVPAATGYVVYVENTSGVTESSSKVVPAAAGINYITHSGVDVVKGVALYYRVQAVSGGQSSILSAEVTGTPQQSITGNQLNDVAWDGSDALIAVGDSGVIISSSNGLTDDWHNAANSVAPVSESLAGVTWENGQFLIVGAGGTVLSGLEFNWSTEATGVTADLEDVTWLGDGYDGYIAVGKNDTIITSDSTGSIWTPQFLPASVSNITLEGVASNGTVIVAVGTNGTILTSSNRGVDWQEVQSGVNNDLNDVTWDGNQFGVVGSNDTILTSTDGGTWTSHVPGTPDITFVAASQWDSSLPVNPVLGAVGSAGTFVVSPDSVTGLSIPTGTNQQLSGMTWVDDGVNSPYFVIVGNDGTVLTSQLQ